MSSKIKQYELLVPRHGCGGNIRRRRVSGEIAKLRNTLEPSLVTASAVASKTGALLNRVLHVLQQVVVPQLQASTVRKIMSVHHPETDAQFDALIAGAGDKLVVIDFFATW